MDYDIKINDNIIKYSEIHSLLKKGKTDDSIKLIIEKTQCSKHEAEELVKEIKNEMKPKINKIDTVPNVVTQYIDYTDQNIEFNSNRPKCPTCQSTNIEKISTTSKVVGAGLFGLFSKTAKSQFECKNCGYKW